MFALPALALLGLVLVGCATTASSSLPPSLSPSPSPPPSGRRMRTITLKEIGTSIVGALPTEVVKRIVRQHFSALRLCYEAELKKDPSLAGTVSTALLIDEEGVATSVEANGGSMTNPAVRECIVKVFASMSFPKPEGGKVKVTYPIDFTNHDEK